MNEKEPPDKFRQMAVYMTLPFVLALPPIIGWWMGHWLDRWLGTSPYLMYIFIVLGFVAAAREFYRIVQAFKNDT